LRETRAGCTTSAWLTRGCERRGEVSRRAAARVRCGHGRGRHGRERMLPRPAGARGAAGYREPSEGRVKIENSCARNGPPDYNCATDMCGICARVASLMLSIAIALPCADKTLRIAPGPNILVNGSHPELFHAEIWFAAEPNHANRLMGGSMAYDVKKDVHRSIAYVSLDGAAAAAAAGGAGARRDRSAIH
jgi:hypothetical protein